MQRNVTMQGKDAVSGSLGECYITIGGNRYNFMQLINFEASWENNIMEVPILGQVSKGHKSGAANGSWKATAHYNQSVFRKMLLHYKNTGEMPYFQIQVTNEDPTSAVGRQTITYLNCLMSGGILSKLDADSEYLDEDVEGTFDDWEMPESFTPLPGMQI